MDTECTFIQHSVFRHLNPLQAVASAERADSDRFDAAIISYQREASAVLESVLRQFFHRGGDVNLC